MAAAITDLTPTSGRQRRYGLRRIEIVSIRIVDSENRIVKTIESLQPYRLVCRIRAKEAMNDVCFGFLVRDQRGLDLFGWDQHTAKATPLDWIAAGEEREIAAKFCANLAGGHYFLTVALAQWDLDQRGCPF